MGNYINEAPERTDRTNRALEGITLNLPKEAKANIKLFMKWGWYASMSEFARKAIMELIEKNMDFFDKSGALKTAVIEDGVVRIPGRKPWYVRRVLD